MSLMLERSSVSPIPVRDARVQGGRADTGGIRIRRRASSGSLWLLSSATAIAGTLWFVLAIGTAAVNGDDVGRGIGIVVVAILATMMWTARDAVRHSRHNRFEAVHRYGGWRRWRSWWRSCCVTSPGLCRDVASGMRPTHLLVRRMRGYGFMHHAQTYERVLFVATGAGIGPVLPYLVERSSVDYECLWIGRNHRETIGDVLVSRIMQNGRVTLIDSATGRPEVGKCVAEIAERFDAVFIVSNQRVRDEVAIVCQRLNVPWYGPTFDS